MSKKVIVFTGGGTGGHIFPIISIVRGLKKIAPNEFEYYYLGPEDPPELIAPLELEGIKVKFIKTGKIRRYFNIGDIVSNVVDLVFYVPIGILQAFGFVFSKYPDLVFCKGGYGSLPTALSAFLLRTPIFLHESDLEPGLANKIISKFSLLIFTSFQETSYFNPKKTIFVGNPVRKEMFDMKLEQAIDILNITGEKKVVAFLGGSQGARFINEMILNAIKDFIDNFEIIHQTGKYNYKQVSAEALASLVPEKRKYYHPFPVLTERQLAATYKIADIIVSRGGAGAIFEIAASGKPSIIIPFPFAAKHHQEQNAFYYQKKGACIVLEQEVATPHFFLEKIKSILNNPTLYEKMSKAAKEFATIDAGDKIARYIVSYLKPEILQQKEKESRKEEKIEKLIKQNYES